MNDRRHQTASPVPSAPTSCRRRTFRRDASWTCKEEGRLSVPKRLSLTLAHIVPYEFRAFFAYPRPAHAEGRRAHQMAEREMTFVVATPNIAPRNDCLY
jgi:hypothetical protein